MLSSLASDVAEWTQEGPFRDAMRSLWTDYPRCCSGSMDESTKGDQQGGTNHPRNSISSSTSSTGRPQRQQGPAAANAILGVEVEEEEGQREGKGLDKRYMCTAVRGRLPAPLLASM
jgi:hypothetical protein